MSTLSRAINYRFAQSVGRFMKYRLFYWVWGSWCTVWGELTKWWVYKKRKVNLL